MNKDYNACDHFLFGEDYNKESYMGGIRYFDGIDYDTLSWLVDSGYADPDDCQNSSPSIGDFLNDTDIYKANVSFDGYAVSPERNDYRVSIDTINIIVPFDDAEMLSYFIELYHSADEFTLYPDAVTKTYNMRAWWD